MTSGSFFSMTYPPPPSSTRKEKGGGSLILIRTRRVLIVRLLGHEVINPDRLTFLGQRLSWVEFFLIVQHSLLTSCRPVGRHVNISNVYNHTFIYTRRCRPLNCIFSRDFYIFMQKYNIWKKSTFFLVYIYGFKHGGCLLAPP